MKIEGEELDLPRYIRGGIFGPHTLKDRYRKWERNGHLKENVDMISEFTKMHRNGYLCSKLNWCPEKMIQLVTTKDDHFFLMS